MASRFLVFLGAWVRRSVLYSCLGLLPAALPADELPPLPQINPGDFEPGMQAQVQKAYVAARDNPGDPDLNGQLGMLMQSYQQLEFAEVCYRRALYNAPSEFRWGYYLGLVLVLSGKHEEAVTILKSALSERPDYLPARLRLAESLVATGGLEESEVVYRRILEKEPTVAEAYYGMGRIASARKQTDSALEYYRKACELFPSYGAAHYALALAYRLLGDKEKAKEHFALNKKFQTTMPPLQDPLLDAVSEFNAGATDHLKKGVGLGAAGLIHEAIAEHERALELDPNMVQAHLNLINYYGRMGRLDRAEEHCAAALALSPNLAELHYNYAILKSLQGDLAQAAEAFKRALEINPSYPEAHSKYGSLLMIQGQLAEAEREYRLALENDPNLRAAHFNLARILIQREKTGEAIDHLHKTLVPEDEDTPRYKYALGAAYSRAGNLGEALRYLREARTLAASLGLKDLLASIEKDLSLLEQKTNPP